MSLSAVSTSSIPSPTAGRHDAEPNAAMLAGSAAGCPWPVRGVLRRGCAPQGPEYMFTGFLRVPVEPWVGGSRRQRSTGAREWRDIDRAVAQGGVCRAEGQGARDGCEECVGVRPEA